MSREIKFRFWYPKGKVMNYDLEYDARSLKVNSVFKSNYKIPMQFTGLKDKNGKDIYEGDIVEKCKPIYPWLNIGVVSLTEFEIVETYDPISHFCLGWNVNGVSLCEIECIIVGNIYENPKLS